MSEAVFLDTSALYEAADRGGRFHAESADELRELLRRRVELLVTDLVVAEFHGLTLGRLGPRQALLVTDRLLRSARVEVLATGPTLVRDAVDYLRSHPDRRLSLVDATSFLVMRARGCRSAFALDQDFAAEGFAVMP